MTKLRLLRDLTQLEAGGNPVSEQLPHYRALVLFHLRPLNSLDGRHVTAAERHHAIQRFQQGGLDELGTLWLIRFEDIVVDE